MSDYWWDRSGSDPDLERVEALLARLAFRGGTPPASLPPPRRSWRLAVAGAAVAGAGLLALWVGRRDETWSVYALAGTPAIEGTRFSTVSRWKPGQALETGPDARAKILVGRIGEVDLEPGSRLRLLRAGRRQQRLALDRGGLRAFIWAPPRRFFIETREAVAADLGCAYSLHVDDAGGGWLRVAFGWVSFTSADREVYVPAGASCALYPGRGSGTPHYDDASPHFKKSLLALDVGEDTAALSEVLAAARQKDVLTLIQLLPRFEGEARARTFDRMAALVPPPPGVDRDLVLRGDQSALGRYWGALGLGELKWWKLGRDLPGPPGRP